MTAYPSKSEAKAALANLTPEEWEQRIEDLPSYEQTQKVATLDLSGIGGNVKPVILAAWADFAETMAEFGAMLAPDLSLSRLATNDELRDAVYRKWQNDEYQRRQNNGE